MNSDWRCITYVFWLSISLSFALALLLPDETASHWISILPFFDTVSNYIPSIGYLVSISAFPSTAIVVFTIMWCFLPLYVFILMRHPRYYAFARLRRYGVWAIMLIVVGAIVLAYGAIFVLGSGYNPDSLLRRNRLLGLVSNSKLALAIFAPVIPFSTAYLVGYIIHVIRFAFLK